MLVGVDNSGTYEMPEYIVATLVNPVVTVFVLVYNQKKVCQTLHRGCSDAEDEFLI